MELLPCPFCGSNDISIQYPLININNTEIKEVICENCLVQHDINIWNTRHSPWISVKDRLPDFETRVLAIDMKCNSYYPHFAYYNDNSLIEEKNSWGCEYGYIEPTHWMPLPYPPKETE